MNLNFDLLKKVLFPKEPPFPEMVEMEGEELPFEGLTMGTLFIGRAGTGKTSSLARHLLDYFKTYPDRAIFVLDWSGSITDSILYLTLQEPENMRESLIHRLIYDDIGNPEWVMPLPEFSEAYGNYEDQVNRVSKNLQRLADTLVKGAPLLGGLALSELAPEIFRVLTAVRNEHGETWQMTEAKRLLRDPGTLRRVLGDFGREIPQAKWWLEKVHLEATTKERELRDYSLVSLLGCLDAREIRARIGYYRPGWTAREAIAKGQMVLVDGARLINREMTQHYLFMQAYSLIMAEINNRRPANPNDKPVSLVMDEVYSLIQIPGMAPEISRLSPQYRSRKLQLYIVLQELAQMSQELRPHIWSLGNIVSFAINNFDEAYEIAQQLFKYEPRSIKLEGVGNPIMEPDRGQYLQIANFIMSMPKRQCIMRRYPKESIREKGVAWVLETKTNPMGGTQEAIDDLKLRLLQERAVRLRDALEVIAAREEMIEGWKRPGRPASV